MLDSCEIIDELCRTLIREDFDAGVLPQNPDWQDIRDIFGPRLAYEFISTHVWEEATERIRSWEDVEAQKSIPIMRRIASRFYKYPSYAKVTKLLGEDIATQYRTAFEVIENDSTAFLLFAINSQPGPTRKFDVECAVSVIVDIISPFLNNFEAMERAYNAFVYRLRARRRERMLIATAKNSDKKVIVRSIGIWFPMTKDIPRWLSDPRTREVMPEFLNVMKQVWGKMKLVRSYLQYVPRRGMSVRACADINNNLKRMKSYLRGDM
jgi:hypothetical protein